MASLKERAAKEDKPCVQQDPNLLDEIAQEVRTKLHCATPPVTDIAKIDVKHVVGRSYRVNVYSVDNSGAFPVNRIVHSEFYTHN